MTLVYVIARAAKEEWENFSDVFSPFIFRVSLLLTVAVHVHYKATCKPVGQ